jgi:hypothetical protein
MVPIKTMLSSLLCLALLAGPALAAPADISSLEAQLSYPQVYGLGEAGQTINRTLAAEIDAFAAKLNESINSSPLKRIPTTSKMQVNVSHGVDFNESPLLSVTITEWFYTGGAHPMRYLRAFTFDTRTGERLQLADLFKGDADYRAKLNEIMNAQIAARKISVFPFTPFKGIRDDQEFFLSPEGLVVYYQLYEYTPYVAGFLKFPIPYDAVADILTPEFLAVLRPSQP